MHAGPALGAAKSNEIHPAPGKRMANAMYYMLGTPVFRQGCTRVLSRQAGSGAGQAHAIRSIAHLSSDVWCWWLA
jgi:hypothetical protein